jgi:hypothetical protein
MPKPKEAEVEANNGMQTYYNITFVIFGLLSLYCFDFYTKYELINCLVDNSELDPPDPDAKPTPPAALRRFLEPLYKQQLTEDFGESWIDDYGEHPSFMTNPIGSVRGSYRRHM